MKASEAIKVCLPPELRREVERTAEEEGRSLSGVLRRVVTQWAAERRQQQSQAAA